MKRDGLHVIGDRVKLVAWVVLVLLTASVAFGAAILGIPIAYQWWM